MYEYYMNVTCDMSICHWSAPLKLEDVKVTNAVPVPGSVS